MARCGGSATLTFDKVNFGYLRRARDAGYKLGVFNSYLLEERGPSEPALLLFYAAAAGPCRCGWVSRRQFMRG